VTLTRAALIVLATASAVLVANLLYRAILPVLALIVHLLDAH